MINFAPRFFKFLLKLAIFLGAAYFVFSLLVRPSLDRDWSKDQAVLARAQISGNIVIRAVF